MFLASPCPAGIPSRAVELRHLRYFVAVAEMENVSRAAMQRLHVSQPSLSRQIRDLEDEMGVQLLERTAKSVRLTDAGRAFLDEARAILKQTDDAVRKVRTIAGKGETELHIGDWPLATSQIMPALLRAYHNAMPGVRVKLHDWPVEKNIAAVRDGRLQLAILMPPLKANALEELRFQELATVRVSLAVSSDHPFAKKKIRLLAEARARTFIGPCRRSIPRSKNTSPRFSRARMRNRASLRSMTAGPCVFFLRQLWRGRGDHIGCIQ